MVTSVGCPHGCSFCPCPVLTGRKVLRRSPELVLEEMRQIDEPYVYIGDDNLFFDHRHARKIAELIEQEGLKRQYYVLGRADNIVRHPEVIEKWAEIGLKKVFLGLESPGDDEIKALNKKATVAENNRAIEILHSNNIDPLGAFIIDPRYTREDFDRVLEYMDRMRIYYFEFTILTPFPGTRFYDERKEGLMSHDTRLFDLAHSLFPTRLPAADFYQEFKRLHRRAASLRRALRIRPAVSPFRKLAFLFQASQLVHLFFSARRGYRELQREEGIGIREGDHIEVKKEVAGIDLFSGNQHMI
ncbi:MAG: radical SAM protein [candidate division Zixibacteria bacterium]|nr:radical SAM protein [candidate division Zixibacteria bacterium]NIS14785.1 radical SAM protein [candidate division Zixibacteria bacterium]NIS46935.1 radical SAM protein [candidate division Zixibacteria bacterium]NIT51325.1 radical SAM protein [candidate division Zixibacteria bacterium]NIW39111.1 radical SAM protein [candidate division Zixibacteria bacterium]